MAPPDEPEDFASLLAEYDAKNSPELKNVNKKRKELSPGDMVRARVLSIGSDAVFLDLGGKSDGMIDAIELRDKDGQLKVKVGDEIEARVVDTSGAAGVIVLRRALGRGAEGKAELEQAYAHQIPVEGLVSGVNKGGVDVQVAGVRAFCPISQLELRHVEDASAYVGQRLQFRITKYDATGRSINLVVSRRSLLEEESKAAAEKTREKLSIGAVLPGRVTAIKDFGVFVDIGGIEGMIHVSELSFQRVTHPKEMFSVGQPVEVQIIRMEKDRIGLSIKSMQSDPWAEVATRYHEGSRWTGRVVRLETFGAFVEIAPGIEGLLHISELSQGKHLRHAKDAAKIGQEIPVIVLGVDADKHRISLGLPTREEEKENLASAPQAAPASLGTFADLLKKRK